MKKGDIHPAEGGQASFTEEEAVFKVIHDTYQNSLSEGRTVFSEERIA